MSAFQPPPTWAELLLTDEKTKQTTFNPIWLNWFIGLTQNVAAGGPGTVTGVTASAPLASSGGAAPNITIGSATGSGAIVLATLPTIIGLGVTSVTFESSEQTLTAATHTAVAHGLGRVPRLSQIVLRCKTTEFGYAVNDEVSVGYVGDSAGAQRDVCLYVNATNIGFTVSGSIGIGRRDSSIGDVGTLTLANWKAVLRAA